MTLGELSRSLALWQRRESAAYRNWRGYVRKHSKSPRRALWYARYKAARVNRQRRERQVAERGVTGVSARGVALIKEFEGFPNNGRPYRDPVGIWTRGYGRIEGIGPNSPPITEAQASKELQGLLDRTYFPAVRALPVFSALNQNQADALTSFVYNVGPGGIAASTGVGRALRAKQWRSAADHLLDWDKAGGRTLAGLSRRRRAERDLFLK